MRWHMPRIPAPAGEIPDTSRRSLINNPDSARYLIIFIHFHHKLL